MPPTPHLEKIQAAIDNDKTPEADIPRLQAAMKRYESWVASMQAVTGDPDTCLRTLVALLNDYKLFVDLELIFDSPNDFLYRQKGQLKLDNSIIEEFLPWLLIKTVPELATGYCVGPTGCYAAIAFEATLTDARPGAAIRVRTKNQDFALSKRLYIKASHSPDFSGAAQVDTYIAYVATDIKTNLDKTMFQEACATARDLKMAVPSSKYYLMCEWLDMTPVSTAPTDIAEVLILRGKRLGSDVRKKYSDAVNRRVCRDSYKAYLERWKFREAVFERWVLHIRALLSNHDPVEEDVLEKGYF